MSEPQRVFVCHGPSCSERGSPETRRGLHAALGQAFRVCTTSCLDSCATGPNVVVQGEPRVHTGVVGEAVGPLAQALSSRDSRAPAAAP